MKKEIEVSARTKEEAIAQAVAELGAPSESALVITVVREARKGFLGFGAVDAVIHAAYQIPDEPAVSARVRSRLIPRPLPQANRRHTALSASWWRIWGCPT